MAETRKKEEPGDDEVKVVDRRRFTPEGELRPDVAAEQARQETTPPEAPPREPPPPRESAAQGASRQAEKAYESRRPQFEPKMDFRSLLLSLSTQAMYQLGLVAEPGAPPPQPDLDAARQTIDILVVLEEKTRNNLTAEEKRLLEQVLYELRMAYVSLGRK